MIKDIITIGCDNLQKRNKIKGVAMQKLILLTIGNKEEDLSLSKIISIVSDKLSEYYIVSSPFKINGKFFSFKKEFIHISEFPDFIKVFFKHRIINKKWKKCSFCGNIIPSDKQVTKKCRSCGKGYFKFILKEFDQWRFEYQGKRDDVLCRLVKDKYLQQVTKLSKRVDFFSFYNGIFYIFEAKNKELSGLDFRDLYTSLFYPLILKRCGYRIDELKIIYNGIINGDLEHQLGEGYANKFGFKVGFYPVKKYLEDDGFFIKSVVVKKIKGKYSYFIVDGVCEQIEVIIVDDDIDSEDKVIGKILKKLRINDYDVNVDLEGEK